MGIQHSRWDFFFFLRQGRLPEGCLGWKVRRVDDGWRVRVTLHPCARLGNCMRPTNPPTPTQTVARPAGFPQRMVRSAPPTEAMIRLLRRFKTPASDSQQGTLPGLGLPSLFRVEDSGL